MGAITIEETTYKLTASMATGITCSDGVPALRRIFIAESNYYAAPKTSYRVYDELLDKKNNRLTLLFSVAEGQTAAENKKRAIANYNHLKQGAELMGQGKGKTVKF